ncbi:SIMPL domain-containing protein [Xanthomonas sp. XNM01]|uniref:SIMPL domain-containing protein n=1 Tax=Xanthomonas sp. XNM01 TaxID=2769289 RepID=UPI001784F964|nr:SIMPL domain-containing protein [Xanthomonas sp. XNM01]MBD9368575.1 SIMPL domain-containing protein [Xanthomonas sp. XNM01]
MSRTLSSLLAVLAMAAPGAVAAQAQPAPLPADATLLQVSADAQASRAPDIATISAGVVTQAADGNGAMRQNAELMNKVLAAIKAAGVADKDVQTSGIHLNPQYRYAENQAPAVTGYQATNTVTIKLRDVAKMGKVLDALVASGANQINGPSFGIDNPEPLYDQARIEALKRAQARAETYAKALGLRVRRIVSIGEGGGTMPVPMPRMAVVRAEAMDSTPVAAGESSVSVQLDVVFELGR